MMCAVDVKWAGHLTCVLPYAPAAVRLALKPDETLARHFESTMKGLGTDEKRLSAAVIRYQTAMPSIEVAYKKIYGRSLRDRVRSDTSGDYGQLLLALLHQPSRVDPDPADGA